MDQHLPKRSLRPAASLPTTAETYGEKHGIDPNLTLALQNIGRRGRQSIAQPTFSRTTTAPVVSFNAPHPGGYGFQTNHEIMKEAQGIINKEAWRVSTRELQPYGSTSSLEDQPERRASTGAAEAERPKVQVKFDLDQRGRGTKRTQEEEEEEGTEVDEDEYQDPASISINDDNHQHVQTGQDEFPPVFQSPNLSQPELFHGGLQQTRFAVPELPDRMKRNLPARRALGKTVSAPVGRLGLGGGGMDVDGEGEGEGEDGFDISEWAGKEDF